MKVTIKQILEARESLINLGSQKLPIKASYNISKIMKAINEELDNFSKMRQDIIDKHTVPGSLEINNEEAVKELNELVTEEVDILNNKIDLSTIETLELSPLEIIILEPFCVFE